ncbi:MAG TPA: CocE/NonD family hydrolase [Candidatus Acidoferrales bacterium]|nr:CocE/NonD family hydrolase [Candidatus Acidoferrales bacterium]
MRRPGTLACLALLVLPLLLLFTLAAFHSPAGGAVPFRPFAKRSVMIPMRDGVRLHTEIYAPRKAAEPLPFLFVRTPYGTGDDATGNSRQLSTYAETLAEGYIFVIQDIRGRFESEGEFVMLRPPRDPADPRAIDESTDAYDTVAWLLKNVPGNNGRVGITGISYPGWLAEMAALDPHPAVRAVSEQASIADMFLGDDFHHNGAFRLSYGFEYAALLESGKRNYDFQFDEQDTYNWYLGLGPLSNANARYFHGKLRTWNDFTAHPDYDAFWRKQSVRTYAGAPKVPNLNVAGWWDQEDFYGPMEIYKLQEKQDTNHLNFAIVGPWNHGGWAHGDGRRLGAMNFGSDTAAYFREKIQAPWFAYWLKGQGQLPFKEAETFQTGTNRWVTYDAWPPADSVRRNLYFRENGTLSFDAPETASDEACDTYISDPANPVPYRERPILPTYQGPGWTTWLLEDQSFLNDRQDVVTWKSEPLAEDVTVAGDIVAHLFASTTGTDSDWVVKLIDGYPKSGHTDSSVAGHELIIADEVFRGRFRNSFEKPEAVRPGEIVEYVIDLHTNNHVFLRGHRILVQVQSTWFPLIDRNPQTFVPNIFEARAEDYRPATERVYRNRRYASHVDLPVPPQ